MNFLSNKSLSIIVASHLLILSSCGGSVSPISNNKLTWVPGTFTPAQELDNLCENQSGGSALAEKLWLRSWIDDTYLWYNEVDDKSPAPFSVIEYFDELRTTATTPSGKQKDNYHFSMSTQEWEQLSQSGASVGYGLNIHLEQGDNIDRKITITYTDPDSPAAAANISRGTVIVKVDGISVENANSQADLDSLNAGLFPSETGKKTIFTLEELGANETTEISLTAQTIVSTPVQNVKTLTTENGKVGYLQFNSHIATAEKGLVDAISELQSENITDLVVDLRYNGGGLLALASQLGYMIAGETTENKVFENLTFNEKHQVTDPVTGQALQPAPFYNQTIGFNPSMLSEGQDLPSLNLNRVFILTTADTCSASESLMNGLRGIGVEVVQIGDTTCGKPYGFYPTPNCGTTYFAIQFKGENEQGFGDYADGFIPSEFPSLESEVQGCLVNDDYTHDLGNKNEALLSAALTYSESDSRTCPAVSAARYAKQPSFNLYNQELMIQDNRSQTIFTNNRIINVNR